MGIEIKSISNEALRKMAEQFDNDAEVGNKNGYIDDSEMSIFKSDVAESIKTGLLKDDNNEIANMLGLTKSVKAAATEAPVEENIRLTDDEKKKYGKEVKDKVESFVKNGVSPEELMAELGKKFSNPKYKSVLEEVSYVLKRIPAYDSKEGVEKIHDTVKKQLKNAGKWDGFHKDILDSLEKQAKSEQVSKEFEKLVEQYAEVKRTMQNTDIVKEKGDNFKAYTEIVKSNLQKKGADGKKEWDKSYTKEAFEALEDYAREDAYDYQYNVLEKGTDASTKKSIRKQMRKKVTSGDKYQLDAIQDLKTERKIFARGRKVENRANAVKSVTRTELKDELGTDLFDKLDRKYLDTIKNPDGTYDMSKLSDFIMKYVGANNQVDQSTDDEMAEFENIRTNVNHELGFGREDDDRLTKGETKKLIKYFKIKRQHNDHMPKIVKAAAAGVGAAIAGLAASDKLHVTQKVTLNIADQSTLETMLAQLKAKGVKVDTTALKDGTVNVNILQEVEKYDVITNVLKGLGIGILTDALFDTIFGNKNDEKSCISVSDYDKDDPKYTDAEKYKDYVAHRYAGSPEKVKALHTLVDAYKEKYGDNWHSELHQTIIDYAGTGSKLNPEECRMLRHHKLEDTTPIDNNNNDDEINNNNDNSEVYCDASIEKKPDVIIPTLTYEQTKKWDLTVKTHYPCMMQTYGESKAIRMLKLAQGIRDNDYSPKRMEELYKATRALKTRDKILALNIPGFDAAAYYEVFSGTDLPDIMLAPDKIGDCERKQGAKVGRVTVKDTATNPKKAKSSSYRGSKGDTTINFCDETSYVVSDDDAIKQRVSEYEKRTGTKVRLHDNRK